MHRATHEKLSPDCTNLHSIARRCPPYHTIHTYLAGNSPLGSSEGTHRNNLRSRSSLPVGFQSLPPFRSSYQLQVAAATLYPTDQALPWSLSLPVWSQIQNPIPQLCSIPGRLAACKRRQLGAPQNGALGLSTMRKTPLHRTSLRPRPDASALG